VLDEPSSGLDPIVRRDILGAVIRTIAESRSKRSGPEWLLGPTSRSVDATRLMWAFFRAHPLGRR